MTDLIEVDRRLRRALDLTQMALIDVLAETDLSVQPAATVQVLAVESLQAAVALDAAGAEEINLSALRQLLSNPSPLSSTASMWSTPRAVKRRAARDWGWRL